MQNREQALKYVAAELMSLSVRIEDIAHSYEPIWDKRSESINEAKAEALEAIRKIVQ